MERAGPTAAAGAEVTFRDGLGERQNIADSSDSRKLELLVIRNELAEAPGFLAALRERASRLAGFRHVHYVQIRRVLRLTDGEAALGIISDRVDGLRLSDFIARAAERGLNLDINGSLCLIRQLVPAVAALHGISRDIVHGALGPERLVITPHAHLLVADYAFGAALECLQYSPARSWQDLRIALPRARPSHVEQRADVMGIGVVALSLILGRILRDDEYPSRISELVAAAQGVSVRGGLEPLPPGLRGWLGRALQLNARNSFANADDARADLDRVLKDSRAVSSAENLESLLGRFYAHGPILAGGEVQPATPFVAPVSIVSKVSPTNVVPVGTVLPALSARTADVLESALAAPDGETLLATPARQQAKPTGASALWEFAPEAALSKGPPVAPERGIPANWDKPAVSSNKGVRASLEALQPFLSETASSSADVHAENERRAAPEMFGAATAATGRHGSSLAIAAAVLAASVAVGVPTSRWLFRPAPPAVTTGTLIINTDPSGAIAVIDGKPGGTTPVTLTLIAGSHTVELRHGGHSTTIPFSISAGGRAYQYVELPAAVSEGGLLSVQTKPSGARR